MLKDSTLSLAPDPISLRMLPLLKNHEQKIPKPMDCWFIMLVAATAQLVLLSVSKIIQHQMAGRGVMNTF
jgi:hypothetical protein